MDIRRRLFADTDPRAEAVLVDGFRRMSASEKVARAFEMRRTVLDLAMLDLRRRHPDASIDELKLRLASRWLDPDLMTRAFGWDPRVKGY